MSRIQTAVLIVFSLLLSVVGKSNNIQVSNVQLTGQNTIDHFAQVQFDITWENSWRYAGGPANWDAAWIFVKYRIGTGGTWQHAWLNNTGHQSCSGSTISSGLLNPGTAFNSTSNPALGVFLYRTTPGSGTFTCTDLQLRWNYGANNISDEEQVDIKVFAIEMVYVPQGAFYVGSGGTELGAFYKYPNPTVPYFINSEAAITVGPITDQLYYLNGSGLSGDQSGPIPAAYPKGFKAFYAMKYELSQQAYVDFLNTLSRQQQASRVATDLTSTSVSNIYVLSNTSSIAFRNGIVCRPVIQSAPAPIEFGCNYNANAVYNENSDGLCIACNHLSYADVAAYLDWAALRLMSEFEYEKCARGPRPPHPNEFAWGNIIREFIGTLTNPGEPTEAPVESYANFAWATATSPVRTGAFARGTSDRVTSGAGYYGCLELSGNVWELGASVGNAIGRAYTGAHGNGSLTANGDADVSNWPPPATAIGSTHRGGSFGGGVDYSRVSDRQVAAQVYALRDNTVGCRGVRTE